MPVENELKYVLLNDDALQHQAMEAGEALKLEQGYIHRKSRLTVRVRKVLESRTGLVRHFFQTKYKSSNVSYNAIDKKITKIPRIIEISTGINKKDFNDFWENAKGKLLKIRYVIKDVNKVHEHFETAEGDLWQEVWEIDFFKTMDNETYFVMAEVEIPEGRKEPLFDMPDIIKQNTIFRVPLGDSRFSNTRLGDVKYATKLYKSLLSQQKKGED